MRAFSQGQVKHSGQYFGWKQQRAFLQLNDSGTRGFLQLPDFGDGTSSDYTKSL
jgi:hypothetical protein